MAMIILQLLEDVPEWARRCGLNDNTFDILEQVALHPENKDELLASLEYEERLKILVALKYAQDKGLVN